MLLRGLARRHRLVRILVFELIQRKCDAPGKADGFRNRCRMIAEQPRHLFGRLQMPFRIGIQPPTDRIDRGLFPDTGEHVLQRTAGGVMVEHLIGGEQRHFCGLRKARKLGQPAAVVAAIEQACRKPHALGAGRLQPRQQFWD